jgi:hypothetical protein
MATPATRTLRVFTSDLRIPLLASVMLAAPTLGACGGSSPSFAAGDDSGAAADAAGDDGASSDASATSDGATPGDAVTSGEAGTPGDGSASESAVADTGSALTPCPTTGTGAIVAPGTCYVITPAEAGAAAGGENANEPSYLLGPAAGSTPRHQLLLFLNGSGGHPAQQMATPTVNIYDTAASLGYHVLALSYMSEQVIGLQCATNDACYFPTRQAIILGVPETGAASYVSSIGIDEGIAKRVVLTLSHLATLAPKEGWDQFLIGGGGGGGPESHIDWAKLVVGGHSQGGGHAAAIGKLFSVARVVQLSSTCDATGVGVPATWTHAASGTWASPSSRYWGLAAPTIFTGGRPTGGDTTCANHLADWMNLAMPTAQQNDAAATCGKAGDTHSESLKCADNADAWKAMLE